MRFFAENLPGFDTHVGNAWGNAFLDCNGNDQNDILCQASNEGDRFIGRASPFFGLPMFTCSGDGRYSTRASGMSCFSSDMEQNERDGCGWVAAVGSCDRVCVGGFCGVHVPPLEYRGSTNVLYVYVKKYDNERITEGFVWKTVVSVLLVLILLAYLTFIWKRKNMKHTSDVVATNKFQNEVTDEESESSNEDVTHREPAIV
jgi:hypothetical protein